MASRVLLFLALLIALIASSLSLPLAPSNASVDGLEKRQCVWSTDRTGRFECDDRLPTMAEIVARIRDTDDFGLADDKHVAVFWTNLDDPSIGTTKQAAVSSWLAGWLKSRNHQYYWWYEHMNFIWRLEQMKWIINNAEKYKARWGDHPRETFDQCSYQALAAAAVAPDAYLFTKKGVPWGAGTMWEQAEYWQLTNNPNVKRIWRVDPRPWDIAGITALEICKHSEAELLWNRDAGDSPLAPRWSCPVRNDGTVPTDNSDETSDPDEEPEGPPEVPSVSATLTSF